MNRNIMEALNATPQGGSPQHGFSLSNFVDYHKKGGQFMVVGCRDTVPNATYRMAVDGFTRTLPCNTANFAHIKENYYFVHVPLALISRNAYQLEVDRKQEYTSLPMDTENFPSFDLVAVFQRLLEIARLDVNLEANYKFRDMFGFNMAYGAIKLLDMLGYGYIGDINAAIDAGQISVTLGKSIVASLFHGKRPTANRIGAYQCIWYHFFRNDIYDNAVTARSFNFDDVTYNANGGTANYDILTTRQLDDFIVECLQLRYVQYKKDIFTGSMPGTQYGPVSSVTINDTIPINVTGTGSVTGLSGSFTGTPATINVSGSNGNPSVTGGPVTYDGIYESSQFNVNSEGDYPVDFVGDQRIILNSPVQQGSKFIYNNGQPIVNLNSYYTGTSDQSVEVNHHHLVDLSTLAEGAIPFSGSASYTPAGSVAVTGTGSITGISGSIAAGTSLFDVLQLVESQAIQKWRQKSMLAGNKTADQFRAHHGVVPRHLLDHLPDFIGSVDNEIHITEITSTADTKSDVDENNLGDIRGRGYGASDSRTFTFKSDDYGILFLCSAIVPESTYDSFGIDFGNTMVSYTDFFQNEFENIGLQAVPKYLVAPSTNDTPSSPDSTGGDTFNSSDGVIGYAPRYFNYKQYPSKVHGLFNGSRLLLNQTGSIDVFGYADMQSFVMPRTDILSMVQVNAEGTNFTLYPLSMALSNLYVSPRLFNSLFAIQADNTELSDIFFSHVKFICEASQPMTVLGLPQF